MSDRAIADGDVVVLAYTLTDADNQEVLDQASEEAPMAYLHGADNIVVGLERALTGLTAGQSFSVDVAPADGYGERKGPGPQAVPRREFRKDVHIAPGMRFKAQGSDGEEIALWVTKVAGSRVYVDSEHPLVGKRLHFEGRVVAIRDATEDEKGHGHAHGPSGHGHHH